MIIIYDLPEYSSTDTKYMQYIQYRHIYCMIRSVINHTILRA